MALEAGPSQHCGPSLLCQGEGVAVTVVMASCKVLVNAKT